MIEKRHKNVHPKYDFKLSKTNSFSKIDKNKIKDSHPRIFALGFLKATPLFRINELKFKRLAIFLAQHIKT